MFKIKLEFVEVRCSDGFVSNTLDFELPFIPRVGDCIMLPSPMDEWTCSDSPAYCAKDDLFYFHADSRYDRLDKTRMEVASEWIESEDKYRHNKHSEPYWDALNLESTITDEEFANLVERGD